MGQGSSPGAPTTLRRGRVEDRGTIATFQAEMAHETEGMTLDPEALRRGVGRLFEPAPPGFYVVAEEEGGALIGCLLVLSEWSDWRGAEVWWIHSVYVRPEARGQGVYAAMYAYVEAEARRSGARGLRLYVDKRNTGAQAVYARLGMDGDHYQLYERLFD